MSTVLKSGSLNLLEASGPVLACNGTAFSLQIFLQTLSTPLNIQAIAMEMDLRTSMSVGLRAVSDMFVAF